MCYLFVSNIIIHNILIFVFVSHNHIHTTMDHWAESPPQRIVWGLVDLNKEVYANIQREGEKRLGTSFHFFVSKGWISFNYCEVKAILFCKKNIKQQL